MIITLRRTEAVDVISNFFATRNFDRAPYACFIFFYFFNIPNIYFSSRLTITYIRISGNIHILFYKTLCRELISSRVKINKYRPKVIRFKTIYLFRNIYIYIYIDVTRVQ